MRAKRHKEFGGGKVIWFVVLVVEAELLGAMSLGGCNGVARVTLDNIRHC
jgi:hypothetical protein